MPEGPEARCFGDGLRNHILGKDLLALSFDNKSRYHGRHPENYNILTEHLPLKVVQIAVKGKKIIICLEKEIYLVSSLGLEGKWLPGPLNHSNLSLQCSDGVFAYFDDSRHHGSLEIIIGYQTIQGRLEKIGPDLLTEDATPELWVATMRRPGLRSKQICEVLMDQQYFSGIGNYIKAMTLYLARIRPDALVAELSDEHLLELHRRARQVITESYAQGGASLRTYFDFSGKLGGYPVVVYGQKTGPCGGKVLEMTFADNRTTHWVPDHQIIPRKWEGTPTIDMKKLANSRNRGRDGYTVPELRQYCRAYSLSLTGNKPDLIDRLEKRFAGSS